MKKIVAFLLCAALLLPVCAFAQEVVNAVSYTHLTLPTRWSV